MLPLTMMITAAGLDALVDAENAVTDPIEITEIGLSEDTFDVAPTLIGIPGEFKRIPGIAGQSAADNIIHMTATDASADTYELRSLGLYLADGTLFAAFSQADPIFNKVSIASFLLAFDCAFSNDIAGAIEFGDATFLYPPATEIEKGVAELATQAEVDAGLDDERIVTPLKLAERLSALLAPVIADLAAEIVDRGDGDDALQALIDALLARTITGGGLATGGGDLTASRVVTVTKASGAETLARALDDVAVTPLGLLSLIPASYVSGAALVFQIGDVIVQAGNGTCGGDSSTTVTFPVAYSSVNKFIAAGNNTDTGNEGNTAGSSWTLTQGTVVNNAAASSGFGWISIGR